jgi:hypothetical protein
MPFGSSSRLRVVSAPRYTLNREGVLATGFGFHRLHLEAFGLSCTHSSLPCSDHRSGTHGQTSLGHRHHSLYASPLFITTLNHMRSAPTFPRNAQNPEHSCRIQHPRFPQKRRTTLPKTVPQSSEKINETPYAV